MLRNAMLLISFTRMKSLHRYNYLINNTEIGRLTTVKNLGVVFDKGLSFPCHIMVKIDEAMKAYSFILCNCRSFTNIKALIILFYLIRLLFYYLESIIFISLKLK